MSEHNHSVWTHLVRAGKSLADMTVDLGAIAALGYVAVYGNLDQATMQVVGGMIVSVAIGKRYYDAKQEVK